MNKNKKQRKQELDNLIRQQRKDMLFDVTRSKYSINRRLQSQEYVTYSKHDGSMQRHMKLIERKNPWMSESESMQMLMSEFNGRVNNTYTS